MFKIEQSGTLNELEGRVDTAVMAESKNFRIILEPALKSQVVGIFDAQGISQQEGMRRLLTWFCDQSDVVRASILGQLPKSVESDVARMILERMAAKPNAKRAG